jgi:glyoxylase-like metal-dependent hydrolase (beta-lactamase superfamily II)
MMETREISPGVFACLTANETANAGFVTTERGVIVIDSLDTPQRGRELAARIEAVTRLPVLFVINTHYHADHVFGNQAFDAPVIGNCALADELSGYLANALTPSQIATWVEEHPEDCWLVDELEIVYPSVVFDRRLVLDLTPKLMVVEHLGGHTPDATIVDLPDEDVLFAGDLVFEGRVPFLLFAHFGDTLLALRKLERLGARTVVPGHGALCDMAYVKRLADYLEALIEKVVELHARGWDKEAVLDSQALPQWWTEDRPDVLEANIARLYEEVQDRMKG